MSTPKPTPDETLREMVADYEKWDVDYGLALELLRTREALRLFTAGTTPELLDQIDDDEHTGRRPWGPFKVTIADMRRVLAVLPEAPHAD